MDAIRSKLQEIRFRGNENTWIFALDGLEGADCGPPERVEVSFPRHERFDYDFHSLKSIRIQGGEELIQFNFQVFRVLVFAKVGNDGVNAGQCKVFTVVGSAFDLTSEVVNLRA